MKIVLANKYYYLHRGAERYLFELEDLLRKHGHETVPFAMADGRNRKTPWEKFFVSPVQTAKVTMDWQGLRTAGRLLYSFEARKKFAALLDAAKPDLVHVQNIYHQISPSILPEARRRRIPVVLTAHDYALLAPNYGLFHDGAICNHTKPDRYWQAVKYRCVKGSRLASALAAAGMSLHKALGLYEKNVDMVIVQTRFLRDKFIEYGWPAKRLTQPLPPFVDAAAWTPRYEGDYALFVGSLTPEKGIDVLIRAAAGVKSMPLKIVGTGPEEMRLKALAKKLKADNVEFCGFLSDDPLVQKYAQARFLVLSSMSYETAGLITLEAYAAGKPVIASKIGGLAEMVRHEKTGLQVAAGDVDELAEAMEKLWSDPARAADYGRQGRAWVERDFSPEKHYDRLMEVYRSIV
ncbi:glycosyltransferase family 4 protein [Candidatus Uhrbacteria bacterium]|nr:glycosyltransferase family 4 protein [Candidatus Uhrbacteria bacterium]